MGLIFQISNNGKMIFLKAFIVINQVNHFEIERDKRSGKRQQVF